MMKERQQDKTNHCPMCEDAAKKILELEHRVKVLTDAMRFGREELRACQAAIHLDGGFDPLYVKGAQAAMKQMDFALNATPQQTAAQIERWHVEWMEKLPVVGFWWPCVDANGSVLRAGYLATEGYVPLYKIPPLPKESNSPETDLDEALRRQ